MIRRSLLTLPFLLPLIGSPTFAQTPDEIVKKLEITTNPAFRDVPFGDPANKSVDVIGEEAAPKIDLKVPFEYNSDRLTPDAFTIL
jgi:hypothetical protein